MDMDRIIEALQDLEDYNRKAGEEGDDFSSYHRGKADAYSLVINILKENNQ